jgi:hypothetical protein
MKLIVAELVMKLSAFYGSQNFITVLAGVRRQALSGDSWITSYLMFVTSGLPSNPTSRYPEWPLPLTFLDQNFIYIYLSYIVLNFITLTMLKSNITKLLLLQVSAAPCALTH